MTLSWLEDMAAVWLGDMQAVADANGNRIPDDPECLEMMQEYLRQAWLDGGNRPSLDVMHGC